MKNIKFRTKSLWFPLTSMSIGIGFSIFICVKSLFPQTELKLLFFSALFIFLAILSARNICFATWTDDSIYAVFPLRCFKRRIHIQLQDINLAAYCFPVKDVPFFKVYLKNDQRMNIPVDCKKSTLVEILKFLQEKGVRVVVRTFQEDSLDEFLKDNA